MLSFPKKTGHGSRCDIQANGERALKYICFVYITLCWSLTHELQRARVNHVHSKQAVPWYRNEREWYENGVRFSGLTIKSAGLMGEMENCISVTKIVYIWLFLKSFVLRVEPPPLLCADTPNSWDKISSSLTTPPFTGFLWQLRPLILGAEPAAAAHRGPLHPPDPAGLARAHRHPHGAARVPGQVRLSAVAGGLPGPGCLRSRQASPPRPPGSTQPAKEGLS